MNIFVRSSCSP